MKAKAVFASVLLILGLIICLSAAACMDGGASWVEGAVRGVVGIILLAVSAFVGRNIEASEYEQDNNYFVEYCENDAIATESVYRALEDMDISEREDVS